ncbi:hypothetical protein AKJ40_02705 [candidate division MSBL1 archaeon SCGC-AAA259M10]|uniref:Calcineurin-like phosphoesterase domain-containing protein n=1 Tax=candidate division MSBL1 archaeon SCGC-AAA259M10 TaxID=1698270 RepID=A0A133UZK5_9EURY|nr:hypothetical protein AKJ40_02705 [candidate division MSBL1 archaeon SCGC-AAA259M10]
MNIDMELAIISDAHLLQTYTQVFNPIDDFIKVLKEIDSRDPEAIVFAGDMFDKRKTTTAPVLHPEGEQIMTDIRNFLTGIGSPIYAIRGNHEDARVLRGLDQTVETFHYICDDWVPVDNVSIYCLETRYEKAYSRKNLEESLDQVFSELVH